MPKTTKEIFDYYPTICYAGVNSKETNARDFIACEELKNKRWWSEEEIKKALIDCSDIKGKCDIMYLYDLLFGNEE